MAETGLPPLEERHPLVGLSTSIGRSTLRAVAKKELLIISFPSWARQQLIEAIAPLPCPGGSVDAGEGQSLLWTGVGELMSYTEGDPVGERYLARQISKAGYVTDVSDGWIAMSLEGPDAEVLLDLITMPDLAEGSLDIGTITSTVLNHIRMLIWRQGQGRMILLSPASSANSLLHRLCDDLEQAHNHAASPR